VFTPARVAPSNGGCPGWQQASCSSGTAAPSRSTTTEEIVSAAHPARRRGATMRRITSVCCWRARRRLAVRWPPSHIGGEVNRTGTPVSGHARSRNAMSLGRPAEDRLDRCGWRDPGTWFFGCSVDVAVQWATAGHRVGVAIPCGDARIDALPAAAVASAARAG